MSHFADKKCVAAEEFEKARSLCAVLKKEGRKKRRENAKIEQNLTGFFVDRYGKFMLSCPESIAIGEGPDRFDRDRICFLVMRGLGCYDSTAAPAEPRCKSARSGRR